MSKATANTHKNNGKRGRMENLKPWKKGQSGNPKGAPKRGESWTEIIKRVGEMTPSEAAARSLELSKQLLKIGEGVTLKEAVVLRVYGALLFEPQPGLLNTFIERAEGKLAQPISMEPSAALLARLQELGLTLDDVRLDPLAAELFQLAGVAAATGNDAAGTDRGAKE